MLKTDIIELMRSKVDEVTQLLELRGLESNLSKGGNNLYTYVNGIKIEWQIGDATMRLGYGNSTNDIQKLGDLCSTVFDHGSVVNTLKNWVDIKPPNIDDFKILVDSILESQDLDLEKSARGRGTNGNSGILFEGSNFSNAHERMTTLGPRFMNLVCKATNMTLENMDGEWPIEDSGRIDGVEIDEDGNPISIYECQSGIQNGLFLDNEHLSKALLRYPFDSAIIPTLKKIVILAGGYTTEHLNIIKNQASMFNSRKNPIQLILLKTNRINDKIGVEHVEYC